MTEGAATARSTTRQTIMGLAALVVFAAAAWFWFTRSGSGVSTDRRTWDAALGCSACGERFAGHANLDDDWPGNCAKCGKPAAWPLKACDECRLLFLPQPTGDPPRQPAIPRCPKCGGDRAVRSAGPEDVTDLAPAPAARSKP